MGIVLDVKNVARTFSENKGILDISFQLKQREILFLYGEHDTGKTLLLQILIGAILPESGVVKLFGSSDYIKEKNRIGYVPQKTYFIESMTIKETLSYFSLLFGTLDREFEKILDLNIDEKKPVNKLPLYVQRIVNLGVALLGNPDLVLLDEPFDGLDSRECEKLISVITYLNENNNTSFLITGHNYEAVSKIATNIGILSNGRLVANFTHKNLLEDCERCIKLKTPQLTKAITVLQEDYAQYEVLSDDLLRIFCPLNHSSKINTKLVHAGIEVSEIWIAGMKPQEYISKLVRGAIDYD